MQLNNSPFSHCFVVEFSIKKNLIKRIKKTNLHIPFIMKQNNNGNGTSRKKESKINVWRTVEAHVIYVCSCCSIFRSVAENGFASNTLMLCCIVPFCVNSFLLLVDFTMKSWARFYSYFGFEKYTTRCDRASMFGFHNESFIVANQNWIFA